MDLRVTRAALARLRAAATTSAPDECCGLLLGLGIIDQILPAANVHPDPRSHFEIDPQALVDAYRAERSGGPRVIGYYHSHPGGPAAPSATDLSMAPGDGRVWAIVGADDITFWRDDEVGFVSLSYSLEDR